MKLSGIFDIVLRFYIRAVRKRVSHCNNIPLREGSFIFESNQMDIRTFPCYNDYYLHRSNEYLFDRTMTITNNNNQRHIIYRTLMNAPSSLRNNYNYAIEDHTSSQNGNNRIVRAYNDDNITYKSFYGNYELTNSNQRQPQLNRRSRMRPYHNIYCSVFRAKKIAKRLKNSEDYVEAIDDLCFLMNVRNKQPLQAVMKELLLLLEKNEMHNTKNNSDKSTQTIKLQRQVVKKEFCTPIPQGFLKNIMETPILPTKMTVKLEKITPICE